MKKLITILLLSSLLFGCVSAPTGPEFSKVILPNTEEGTGTLVVYRSFAQPTLQTGKISINGKEIYKLPPKALQFSSWLLGNTN